MTQKAFQTIGVKAPGLTKFKVIANWPEEKIKHARIDVWAQNREQVREEVQQGLLGEWKIVSIKRA